MCDSKQKGQGSSKIKSQKQQYGKEMKIREDRELIENTLTGDYRRGIGGGKETIFQNIFQKLIKVAIYGFQNSRDSWEEYTYKIFISQPSTLEIQKDKD